MKEKTFTATIRESRVFSFDKKKEWDEWLEELNNQTVSVTVGTTYPQRSNKQNRYYWGVVVFLFMDHTGMTKTECHDKFREKCNNKIIDVNDKKIRVTMSTASLSTVEFEEYLAKCRLMFFKEFGFIIPEPEECHKDKRFEKHGYDRKVLAKT